MSEPKWQLLTTLSDVPSGEALAHVLAAEGITVRVASEGHLLGQAVPCRLYVDAGQTVQARWMLRQMRLTDEELVALAGVAEAGGAQTGPEGTRHE